jgi:hypothetical protein
MTWNPKESGQTAARRYVESIRPNIPAQAVETIRAMFAAGRLDTAELLASDCDVKRLAGEHWLAYYETAEACMGKQR